MPGLIFRKCLQRHQSRKGGKKDDLVQSHSVVSRGLFYENIDLENKVISILLLCNNHSILYLLLLTKYNFLSVLFHENAKLHQKS